MPRWNTSTVKDDLSKIVGVKKVVNNGPGGDCDSDNLQLKITGTSDCLFVCAFDPGAFDPGKGTIDPSDYDLPMVEVSDGQDSRGGLNSDNDTVGEVYLKVRKYFRTQGFEVVGCLKDYF